MKRIDTLTLFAVWTVGRIDPGLLRRAYPGLRNPRNEGGTMTNYTNRH